VLQSRSHIEAQAAAIQGMEQVRVMGQELLQAKVQNAELKAEIKIRDAALEAKDVLLQSTIQGNASVLQAKDAVIEANRVVLQSKDALLQAKDAEICGLRAELARRNAEPAAAPAAAGGAAAPAPAPGALSSQQLQVRHRHQQHHSLPFSRTRPPLLSPSGASVWCRGAAFAGCRRFCGCSEAADGCDWPRGHSVARRPG